MEKILIIGATGFVGQHLVAACRAEGKEPHAVVRPATQENSERMAPLEKHDVTVHTGSLEDYESLLAACKQVDAVISAVGADALMSQDSVARAAEATGIRFMPSDFGVDPKLTGSGACGLVDAKAAAQAEMKKIGPAYTILNSNCFAEFWAVGLGQVGQTSPPDSIEYYGEGDVPVGFVTVPDVATVAVRAISDPRTENGEVTILVNRQTQEELVQAWEKVSGTSVKRNPVSLEEIEARISSATAPEQMMQLVVSQLIRSAFFRGDAGRIADGALDASELYPDIKFKTMPEFFKAFA